MTTPTPDPTPDYRAERDLDVAVAQREADDAQRAYEAAARAWADAAHPTTPNADRAMRAAADRLYEADRDRGAARERLARAVAARDAVRPIRWRVR
jgi:glycerol-3-phosphate O-acyltransferase